MSLTHLVYVSSATQTFSQPALITLLEHSRLNNQLAAITGLLLFQEGNFMQVLEGEETAVRNTHQRICQDRRHSGLITLLHEPIAKRNFADWSMGFRELNSIELRNLPGYSEFMNEDWRGLPIRQNPERALRLLEVFRQSGR